MNVRKRACVFAVGALLLHTTSSFAGGGERVDFPLRGQHLALTIYRPGDPQAKVNGTIIMSSGDVGWVGLAASMAEFLRDAGYVVIGLNTREYLAIFTTRSGNLFSFSSTIETLTLGDLEK